MAKKRTTVYMREDDLEWLEKYPVADSVSGSAVLVMEWAMRQIQHGAITAVEKFDAQERKTIIAFASTREIPSDISHVTLVIALCDWFRFSTSLMGSLVVGRLDKYKFNALMKKCEKLSPSEVIGLLAWARGYRAQDSQDMDRYINNGE